MALVVFRSRAAAEIFMFAQTAQRLFEILGREATARGVITSEQIPQAIAQLTEAIEQARSQDAAARAQEEAARERGEPLPAAEQSVSLAQRAYPLLEMLRAAQKRNVEVTWGV